MGDGEKYSILENILKSLGELLQVPGSGRPAGKGDILLHYEIIP
jgi:hypothetical protein